MMIEMLLLIPEIILCEIGGLFFIFNVNVSHETTEKMDLGLLATRGHILSMSKEERKKFVLITIKYLLVSLVLTTLVALGTILFSKITIVYVFICITIQVIICIIGYKNWLKKIKDN